MDVVKSRTEIVSPAGVRVNIISLAFTVVAGIALFLRLFTRLILNRLASYEDICIAIAMAFSVGLAAMISEQTINGLGKHGSKLTSQERMNCLKAIWASFWIYSLALTFTKISILVQYLRIFPIVRFQKACYVLLVVVVAFGAWTVVGNVFLCNPVDFFWNKSIKNAHCLDRMIIWFTNAGVNIAQDVVILLLPMPVIQTLQITKSQKKGLVTMLALGASVTVVSVIRLHSLDDIAKSDDLIYDNTAQATLSVIEVNVGIICACLPAMRPLFALMMPKYFSTESTYTDVPIMFDMQQQSSKHVRSLSESTQPGSRTNTTGTNTTGTSTPLPHPLQPPRPTLSRTTSGRISVTDSRPHTPGPRSIGPSRSASPAATHSPARSSPSRAQDRINTLRYQPMAPFSPAVAPGLSIPPVGPGSYYRRPSDASGIIIPSSRLGVTSTTSTKPLPLTPFPVGAGD